MTLNNIENRMKYLEMTIEQGEETLRQKLRGALNAFKANPSGAQMTEIMASIDKTAATVRAAHIEHAKFHFYLTKQSSKYPYTLDNMKSHVDMHNKLIADHQLGMVRLIQSTLEGRYGAPLYQNLAECRPSFDRYLSSIQNEVTERDAMLELIKEVESNDE